MLKRTLISLLLTTLSQIMPAQETTYTVTYEDQPIEAVLKDLTKRTGYEFVYQKQIIEGAPNITGIYQSASLQQILNRTLVAQCHIDYQIVKKTIVLRKQSPQKRFVKKNVKGMVVDEQQIPLPGVNVRLKGTNTGTTTDID